MLALGKEFSDFTAVVMLERLLAPHQHETTFRILRLLDWRPEHLHPIYDHHENRIVDFYLEGAFEQKTPKVFRQF